MPRKHLDRIAGGYVRLRESVVAPQGT
jgi:hypothetical protein